MSQKLNVAVLMGGKSSERDISLISAKEVIKYLDKSKYNIFKYDTAKDVEKIVKDRNKIDVAMPILHGLGGEDGKIQGFLETLELSYVGSKVLASAIAIDKYASKKIYQHENILTPKFQVITNKKDKIKIKLPFVVKPVSQGSSVGTSIVKNKDELAKALKNAFEFENRIIIEEYIEGIEITVPILGNANPQSLPVIEIVPPKGAFFNRNNKYDGTTQEIIPARIPKYLTKQAQEIGIKTHNALGCSGLSRTDMIIKANSQKPKANSQIYVLETNTIPGMTSESLFPKSAKSAGISFSKLLDKLIILALEGNEVGKIK